MSAIDFEELDYTKMMCNVMAVPDKRSPEDEFEVFKKYKEFLEPTPEIDRKKLFRYIPLVYDKHSPLHTVIPDIKKVKGKAAELAGFRLQEDGTFLPNVMQMMECNNREVNQMIIRYSVLHKSAKYHQYVVLREAQVKLSVNIIEDPNKANVASFNDVSERVDSAQQELLSGDNNANLQDSFHEYYFENELQLRPEDIAKRLTKLKQGETIVPSPEKKKPTEVAPKVLKTYQKEDEWVVVNQDQALHPVWIKLPKCEDITQVDGYGLEAKEQFFVRSKMPDRLESLINSCDKIDDIWRALENEGSLYKKEVRWLQDQIYYSHNGYWFFCNSKPTYITGWHYDYLTHWRFGGGGIPEYRDRDRKWYHAWYYAYMTTEYPAKDEGGRLIYEDAELKRIKMLDAGRKVFMGAIGPKGRRAGDSNKFLCALYMESQRHEGKNSDIISCTGDHAKDKLFDEILVPAWQQMPFFYKPITSSNENPEKEIKFVGSRKKADSAVVKGQLKTKIGVSSTATSSKLDGGKEFFLLCDESGKVPDIDVYERHQQLKETVSQGAGITIVGFMGLPSTVGEMEGSGGRQYSKLCSHSMFQNRTASGQTTTGLMLVYISCLEGMEGFVGRYGESIIETPTPEQAAFIGKPFGAREHVESKRKAYLDDNDLDGYNEFVRLFPIHYRECFRTTDGEIGFNTVILNNRIDELVVTEKDHGRQGDFHRAGDTLDGEVYWEDNPKGRWFLSELLNPDQANRYVIRKVNGESQRFPLEPKYTSCADTFAFGKPKGTRLSMGGGAVLRDYNAAVDHGKDIKDWLTYNFVCTYLYRPLDQREYLEDMMMQDEYFGAMQFPENNIKDIWRHYEQRGRAGYLRYEIDVKTRLYKSTPGFDSLAESKQRLFNKTRDFIQDHGHKCVHLKLLMQWKEIEYMDQMTDYDLLTAAGGCLLGSPQIMHLMRSEEKKPERKSMMYPRMTYK